MRLRALPIDKVERHRRIINDGLSRVRIAMIQLLIKTGADRSVIENLRRDEAKYRSSRGLNPDWEHDL